MAQEDYYYEIQLTNKQLVFYFLAGATGLILAFLAGVMVGRGVDSTADAVTPEPVAEERKTLVVTGLNELVFVLQLTVRSERGVEDAAAVSVIIKKGFEKLGAL